MGFPSRLAQAKLLAVYYDNYINYLSTLDDRSPNIGNGTEKPPQTLVYIKPFALDLATNQYLPANATAIRWTAYSSNFANYAKDTLVGGTDTVLDLNSARPARVVIKTGVSAAKTVKTSSRTKRKYITHGGTSGSIPFGRNLAGDDEYDVYNAIKAAITGAGGFNSVTTKVSRVREKI